jgi:hypothetical protein
MGDLKMDTDDIILSIAMALREGELQSELGSPTESGSSNDSGSSEDSELFHDSESLPESA